MSDKLEIMSKPNREGQGGPSCRLPPGDPQPLHLDEDAPETKEYGGLITCSAHTFAIFMYLTSRNPVKTAAIAVLGFDELRMLRPLRPDDRTRAVSVCLEKRESPSKPDRGITSPGPSSEPARRGRLLGEGDRHDPEATRRARLDLRLRRPRTERGRIKRRHYPSERGLTVRRAGNRLKSRSALHRASTPWARQTAAIRAS
jgi:hypothetical protein